MMSLAISKRPYAYATVVSTIVQLSATVLPPKVTAALA